jgi:transcriptional regulator with XRE-family HTH domain
MSEVVALLLDDAMPPERLGALLLAARKRSGLKRKLAAAAAGTTAAKLRSYERGDKPVPADVCAQLAECYGDDLTAHVPLRMPLQLVGERLVIDDLAQPVGPSSDDVLAGYVDIVHRLRDSAPGDPLALRTADIVALAGALGRDRAEIERRIADLLGCTTTEASRLHGELLRRKVILPVAGLAAGMAAFAGVAYAAQSPAPRPSISAHPAAATTPSTARATSPSSTTPTTQPHAAPTTTPTTAVPALTATTAITTPTTEHPTDATVPAAQRQTDVPVSVAAPRADPNDPPVSVLPGETPITIIGEPDSTSAKP